jgi:hypothetical protein
MANPEHEEFERVLAEKIGSQIGTPASRALFALAISDDLGAFVRDARADHHRPECLSRVSDRLAAAIDAVIALRSELQRTWLLDAGSAEWTAVAHFEIEELRLLQAEVEKARNKAASVPASQATRGPRTAMSDSLALSIAWSYASVFQKVPAHSNHGRAQTPYDRVCDAVNDFLAQLHGDAAPRISVRSRGRAVKEQVVVNAASSEAFAAAWRKERRRERRERVSFEQQQTRT